MNRPGSRGEHEAQEQFGTTNRATAFYANQMLEHLNPHMQDFISRQEMVFISTADAQGECDCSFRAGAPGFVQVLDEKRLAYPEYRGNGVLASVGNIRENPHMGMIFVDFFQSAVGLHVNGHARVVDQEQILEIKNITAEIREAAHRKGGRHPECWVVMEVDEAYIHCSKHIPLLKKLDKHIAWGTDDEACKGGDYFKAKSSLRPWSKNISSQP